MKVKQLYHELLLTTLILNIFDSILTAITVFSISYLIIYFYRINYWFAIIAAMIFFIRSLYLKIKQNKILVLEKKYPDLKERLRTSYDYQTTSNTVIDSLHKDIVKYMRKVDVNAILNMKKIVMKIFTICIILFSILYFSSIGLDILDIKVKVVNSVFYERVQKTVQNIFETREEVDDRPKGDPRLYALGNQELNISIDTYNTELNIDEISEGEKNDFGGHYPAEISGAAQEIYETGIPREYKDIIKEYFRKINN